MRQDNVPGFPGYYISKSGRVYSRYIKGSHKMSTSFHRIRCYQRKGDGRYKISLVHKEKGKIKCYRSRLVALAWVCNTNPEEYTEVCHIDNNPLNDYYKNFYWGTKKMNSQQMVKDGRLKTIYGKKHNNPNYMKRGWHVHSKVNEEEFKKIIKLRKRGFTNKYIIQKLSLKITSAGISSIYKKYQEGYYTDIVH